MLSDVPSVSQARACGWLMRMNTKTDFSGFFANLSVSSKKCWTFP